MKSIFKDRGQIAVPLTMVGSLLISTILGAAAYYGAISGQAAAVAAVDLKAEVLKSKQEYTDMRMENIENKIDALLRNRGINPEELTKK